MPGIGLGFKPGKSDGSGPSPEPKLQEKSVSIVENGNSSVSPDSDYDGLSKVNITVDVPELQLEQPELKTLNDVTKEVITIFPSEGYDGLASDQFQIGSIAANKKTITTNTNGTTSYTPESDSLGFTKVEVVNETPMYYNVTDKSQLPTINVRSGTIGTIGSNVAPFEMGMNGVSELRFDHSLDFSKIYNPIINDAQLTKGYFPTILIGSSGKTVNDFYNETGITIPPYFFSATCDYISSRHICTPLTMKIGVFVDDDNNIFSTDGYGIDMDVLLGDHMVYLSDVYSKVPQINRLTPFVICLGEIEIPFELSDNPSLTRRMSVRDFIPGGQVSFQSPESFVQRNMKVGIVFHDEAGKIIEFHDVRTLSNVSVLAEFRFSFSGSDFDCENVVVPNNAKSFSLILYVSSTETFNYLNVTKPTFAPTEEQSAFNFDLVSNFEYNKNNLPEASVTLEFNKTSQPIAPKSSQSSIIYQKNQDGGNGWVEDVISNINSAIFDTLYLLKIDSGSTEATLEIVSSVDNFLNMNLFTKCVNGSVRLDDILINNGSQWNEFLSYPKVRYVTERVHFTNSGEVDEVYFSTNAKHFKLSYSGDVGLTLPTQYTVNGSTFDMNDTDNVITVEPDSMGYYNISFSLNASANTDTTDKTGVLTIAYGLNGLNENRSIICNVSQDKSA